MTDSKVYEFAYVHVAPGHMSGFDAEFRKKIQFLQKHGYNVFGKYRVAFGGFGEYLMIVEYENVEQKLALLKPLMADAEYMKFNEGFMKMVHCLCSTITKALPFYKVSKPANPKNCLSVRRYDVKGDPYKAIADFKECADAIYEKHVVSRGLTMIGAFVPVFGESTNAYYALWDMNGPDAMSRSEEVGKAILADTTVADKTKKMWDHVTSVSSKIYAPFD